ncbi:MAG: hypothetical protein E6767_14365 [Dysgonomonas sp.]|nr:hypothetical protein [Dysgonomonas sp.]
MNRLNGIFTSIISNDKNQYRIFILTLLLISLAMVLFYMPFYPGHDSYFHFGRLQHLMDLLKEGQFMIAPDYSVIDGYGYFTRAFYPDFTLIPFAVIGNITNVDFAYQFTLFTMTFFCGFFTYKMVNRIYNSPYAASISALLYTFAMYRLLDIYQRGALAEAMSFTFVPLILWGLYEVMKGDYKRWYILTIGYSLMILTHLLASALTFIVILILIAIYYKSFVKEPKRIKYLVLSGLVTLPIVSYYIFPMLEQMLSNTFYYEKNPLTYIGDNTLGIKAIIRGMFYGVAYPDRPFTPATGLLLTCAIALRLFVYGKSALLRSADICVLIGFIFVFASTYFFPWGIFPFNKLSFIQMPWRLYEFASLFFAVAGGYYLSQIVISGLRRMAAMGVLCVSILFVMLSDAQMYHSTRDNTGISREKVLENNYHLIGTEYLPSKVPSLEFLANRKDCIKGLNNNFEIKNFKRDKGTISFDIETEKNLMELPLVYYKGYSANFNNEKVPVLESKSGLVQIVAFKKGHMIVAYSGTLLQKISFYISIISILFFCGIITYSEQKR